MNTYYIFEHHYQQTSAYQRFKHTAGFECLEYVEAPTESEAMEKWLKMNADAYDITDKGAVLIECCSCRTVWEPGSTTGEFGDFQVKPYTLDEIEDDQNLYRAAKHLIQC